MEYSYFSDIAEYYFDKCISNDLSTISDSTITLSICSK